MSTRALPPGERRSIVKRAVFEALGLPSLILLAGMTGFGSLARDSGLSLMMALTTTAGVWALPGQVAMADLYGAGVSAGAIVLAVSLANARFLPMAASFVPLLQNTARRRWVLYFAVHLLSINSWAAGLREFPTIAPESRYRYFIAFASTCLFSALLGTALGYYLVDSLPTSLALGLLFLNPVFFAILLTSVGGRSVSIALVFGTVIGPPTFLLAPDWSLLITGFVGGTLAFLCTRARA